MNKVTSKDGTAIVFDKLGKGPTLVLVCGGSVDRQSNAGLAEVLAQHFTVYNYDRRGRSDSGDTPPYAIEREVEDIEAVLTVHPNLDRRRVLRWVRDFSDVLERPELLTDIQAALRRHPRRS